MAKKHLFTRLQIKVRPKGLHSFAFYILIFAFPLTSYGISSTKDNVRKNNLFMQNKAKFRKVKLNVNQVLTNAYVQMDTWSIRTKQSQTNPNKAKLKKAEMNVTSIITVAYENKPPIQPPKKQSQMSKRQKPMQTSLPKGIMKKTAFSASKKQTQNKPNLSRRSLWRRRKQTQFLSSISVAGQCSIMLNCTIFSGNTSTGAGKFRESADTYYDRENTLENCCEMVMLMPDVAYTTFRPKGNSNSRSKYAFEVETIQFGGKPL